MRNESSKLSLAVLDHLVLHEHIEQTLRCDSFWDPAGLFDVQSLSVGLLGKELLELSSKFFIFLSEIVDQGVLGLDLFAEVLDLHLEACDDVSGVVLLAL